MSPLAARVKVHLHVTSPPPLDTSPLASSESTTPDQSILENDESELSEQDEGESERSHVSTAQEDEETEEEEAEPNVTVNTTDEMRGSETINDESNEDDLEDVEGTLGSLKGFIADTTTETDASPNATYEESFSNEEESEESTEEEEDVPEADADDERFPPSPSNPGRTPSSAAQYYSTPAHYEKENMIPTKEEDGPSREADEFGFFDEKSQVIQSGSKSSKKR